MASGGGYNGRRAPNVSQYLQNLNTIPSTHDLAHDISLGDGDLDFLTNAEFFDFETSTFNPNVDYPNRSPQEDEAARSRRVAVNAPPACHQFSEFQTYPFPVNSSPAFASHPNATPFNTAATTTPQAGDKRKASLSTSPADLEEETRFAAEEDKRRRNTAASARFRVKKKQREQALEKQAKAMTDQVNSLKGKVQQLEMENKWLKGLITDKGDGKVVLEKEIEERSKGEHVTGVGTVGEEQEEYKDELLDADADADADAEVEV